MAGKVKFYTPAEVKELKEIKRTTKVYSKERIAAIKAWAEANGRTPVGVALKLSKLVVHKPRASKVSPPVVQHTSTFSPKRSGLMLTLVTSGGTIKIPVESFSVE